VKSLKEKYGKFQGLVLSAGILEIKPTQLISLDEMKRLFDINYFSPVFMAKGFADRRINNGKGSSIVAISSLASTISERGMTSYSGAKAALSASMKVLGRELVGSGVRVNVLSPASVSTQMRSHEAIPKERASIYPLGIGKVEDVANFVAYLLSDKAKWLASQNYIVDCGRL